MRVIQVEGKTDPSIREWRRTGTDSGSSGIGVAMMAETSAVD